MERDIMIMATMENLEEERENSLAFSITES